MSQSTISSPFKKVLDELDKKILELLQAVSSSNKEEMLRLIERYIRMRGNMVEPYRRGPLTPLERSMM